MEFFMDLAKHTVTDWATLKIEDAEIDIYGRDSKKFRDMVRDFERTRDRSKEDTIADIEQRAFDRTIAMTKAIRGIELDGKPIKDAAQVYTLAPGIYEAVMQFMNSRANFLPKA